MSAERSAGAIIFWESPNSPKERLYLLLHHKKGHWDFPKGHIEPGEALEETIRREVEEETGISNLLFLQPFEEEIQYSFESKGKKIDKHVVFYLAKTSQKEITLSSEHVDFRWLPYEEALKQITFPASREILEKSRR